MKYKIGNVEVEAVQWKYNPQEILDLAGEGSNALSGTSSILIASGCSQIDLKVNDYLVKTDASLFKLSEQDFRNMATKIKEPKFKVGDKAYNIERDSCSSDDTYVNNIKFIRHIVSKISSEDGFIYYFIKGGGDLIRYKESALFTLEEAIEKLKEL